LIQQGYLSSEPFSIENEGHFKPKLFLLADVANYITYSNTMETTAEMVKNKLDVVQRIVDASIEGWCQYLYGDPAPPSGAPAKATSS
jgi:NitT/TauT family transport system substrate-binding protein